MNNHILALIAGILATAFTQIKNVLSGAPEEVSAPSAPPAKRGRKPKEEPADEPEDEPEDDTTDDGGSDDITTNIEVEDETDYDELRNTAKKKVTKLFSINPGLKPQVAAMLKKYGGVKLIGDIPDEHVEAFIAAVSKLR